MRLPIDGRGELGYPLSPARPIHDSNYGVRRRNRLERALVALKHWKLFDLVPRFSKDLNPIIHPASTLEWQPHDDTNTRMQRPLH